MLYEKPETLSLDLRPSQRWMCTAPLSGVVTAVGVAETFETSIFRVED
jgi:hypothetical protein